MAKALVVGLGISGISASEFLIFKGYKVVGIDSNPNIQKLDKIKHLIEKEVEVFHDSHPLNIINFDLVVISPGVPSTQQHYLAAIAAGIETIGEAELALREIHQRCLGLTGTNGKTTVTLLVEHVLNSCGLKSKAVGNVGNALTYYCLAPKTDEILSVELSSYQLETMKTKVLDAGVILNITPDHLDRYGTMQEYAKAKCLMQDFIKEGGDLFVHQSIVDEYKDLLQKSPITYGHTPSSLFWTDKEKFYQGKQVECILPPHYKDLGVFESENALAAFLLCKKLKVTGEQFTKALETFKKPSHRIEFIKTISGVDYYDDSKGTNLDAVIKAVMAMRGPVILIAGGVDKGASYAPWAEILKGRVKSIIVIGQAAEKICRELSSTFKVEIVDHLSTAVIRAQESAERGDCVLLSPGCASFDMFRDYAHRGEEFKRCVDHLEERRK